MFYTRRSLIQGGLASLALGSLAHAAGKQKGQPAKDLSAVLYNSNMFYTDKFVFNIFFNSAYHASFRTFLISANKKDT